MADDIPRSIPDPDPQARFWEPQSRTKAAVERLERQGRIQVRSTQRAGSYAALTIGTPGTGSFAVGECRAFPVFLASPITIDQIVFEVTTAAPAGGRLRAGFYTQDAAAASFALVADLGTVPAGTTGQKTFAGSYDLPQGVVWVAFVAQGAGPVTLRTMSQVPFTGPVFTGTLGAWAQPIMGWRPSAAVTGAMPATVSAFHANAGDAAAPRCAVRAA